VIRRYIPKGIDLTNYSLKEIKTLEEKLNSRPMKCLNWKTPSEMMRKEKNML